MHAMRTCGGMEVQPQSFLTWAVDGLERSAWGSDHSASGQRVPGKHSTGGWLGGRGGVATLREKYRVSATNQTVIPRLSNPQISVNVLPKSGIESRFLACTIRTLFTRPTASTRTELKCMWTMITNVRINYDRATTITNMATMRNIFGFTQSNNVTPLRLQSAKDWNEAYCN